MALVVFDRVKETSTTAGTGTIVLAGAVVGYQSFAVVGNGNTTYYTIADQSGANWEVGIGTYYSGNVSLSRNTILASSNANSAVTFGSNTKDVFITYPAEDAVYLNSGIVYAGASANVAFSNITASNAVITTGAFTNATVSTTPAQNTDVANKAYVDQKVSTGLSYHTAANVATTTDLATTTGGTVTYNQPNGAGNGVGATITLSVALTTLDGYSLVNNDRVLVKNEINQTYNGAYSWATGGTVLTRTTDANTYGADANQLSINDYFYVTSGNVNKGTAWVVDAPVGTITFGTSNITFAQFSSAQIYSAGTGLTLANTTFSISNTAVTTGTYGTAARSITQVVNAQGQLTNIFDQPIAIANTQVSGLGTMSTQNANSVAITGGTINNVSLSNITYGGLGTMSTQNANNVAISGGVINNVQIGPTTANTGAFTNLSASGPFFATANITTTSYTGYLYGNNSAVITASTTIPNTAITGLGTMATQNANAVAITGGTVSNVAQTLGSINNVVIGNATANTATFTNVNATTYTALANIAGNSPTGAYSYGALNYTDVNIFAAYTTSANTYAQVITQNTSNASAASVDYVVSNNLGGPGSFYGNFGMNSANYSGTGAFNAPNAVYLLSSSSDLAIGTLSANSVRFVVGGSATDAFTINSSGALAANASFGSSGQVLTSAGSGAPPTWTTSSGAQSAGNSSILLNNVNITSNATIAAGQNGFSVGPVTTANGVSVTIASGQQWVVI